MLGLPVRGLPLSRGAVSAAAAASGLAFLLSLAALATGEPWLALGLWLASGAAAGVVAAYFTGYGWGLYRLALAMGLEPGRPLVEPLWAALVSTILPPSAGPLAYLGIRQAIEVADSAEAANPGIDSAEAARSRLGAFAENVPDPRGLAAASILPPLLPFFIAPGLRALIVASCAAYEALRAGPGRRLLWDKPCRADLVDIVVWSEPPDSALDLEALAEKWSIQD